MVCCHNVRTFAFNHSFVKCKHTRRVTNHFRQHLGRLHDHVHVHTTLCIIFALRSYLFGTTLIVLIPVDVVHVLGRKLDVGVLG